MWIVASLWIHEGKEAEFEEYERIALSIFVEHSGEVVARFRPEHGAFEVHILRIGSRQQFDLFRQDARLAALITQKEDAISKSEIIIEAEPVAAPFCPSSGTQAE